MSPQHANRSALFKAEDFPHLRDFLRGYFHEDWNDDYGTAREAVEQFCREAGKVNAAKLAEEWERLKGISGENLETTVELLGRLGGAWNPTHQDELEEISATLARYQRPVGRK
jgi:hypothetical protein